MLDQVDQLREIERLRQNRRGPELQDGLRIHVQVRREDDDRTRAEKAGLSQALQEVPAVDAGHCQVEENDVGTMDRERAMPFAAVAGEQHLKTGLAQRGGKHSTQRQIVIDDQDAFAVDARGSLRAGVAVILKIVHAALAPAILATAETDMQNAGHSAKKDRCRRTCSRAARSCARWRRAARMERTSTKDPADRASTRIACDAKRD